MSIISSPRWLSWISMLLLNAICDTPFMPNYCRYLFFYSKLKAQYHSDRDSTPTNCVEEFFTNLIMCELNYNFTKFFSSSTSFQHVHSFDAILPTYQYQSYKPFQDSYTMRTLMVHLLGVDGYGMLYYNICLLSRLIKIYLLSNEVIFDPPLIIST